MERRDIAFGLLAASSAAVVSQRAEAQSCTAPCYAQTAAEKAAGVTPSNTSYPPGNVLRYGAVGDGVTNSSTAFANAVSQAVQTGGAAVYVPGGQFVTAIVLPTVINLRIHGDDPALSMLVAVNTTSDVISLAASAECPGLTIENLSLYGTLSGTASGSGNGIHIPTAATGGGWNCRFANLVLAYFGNSGILDQHGLVSTTVENVQTKYCNGHAIDMVGASGLTFINCFATTGNPGAGKAGFRIHNSNPLFIGCNGIDSGDYWGLFSDTAAQDGQDLYCFPTLINCNVESFGVAGLRSKNSSFVLINTSFIASSSNVKAVVCDTQPNQTGLNFASTFGLNSIQNQNSPPSWANNLPVHSSHAPPYIQVTNSANQSTAPYTFYDDQLALTFTGPTLGWSYNAYSIYSVALNSLATNEANILMHALASLANGAGGSAGTLTNAPAAGNPTKWIPIDDAGTTRYIPAW